MLSARIVPGKLPLQFSIAQILAHLFYLQDILRYASLNPVFWTLCLEVQFYLAYAALLTCSRNDPNKRLQGNYTVAILCSACVLSLLWPVGVITSPLWPGGFLQLWHAFLLGTAAYWSWRNPVLAPFFCHFRSGCRRFRHFSWRDLFLGKRPDSRSSLDCRGNQAHLHRARVALAAVSWFDLLLALSHAQPDNRRSFSRRLHADWTESFARSDVVVRFNRVLYFGRGGAVVARRATQYEARPKDIVAPATRVISAPLR